LRSRLGQSLGALRLGDKPSNKNSQEKPNDESQDFHVDLCSSE
jgi:hypothetical protein